MNDLAKEVYSCFVVQAQEKNISYDLDLPQNEVFIIGDYEKLEISLLNLVSNAFKYTPE